jgi:hypothetical protein
VRSSTAVNVLGAPVAADAMLPALSDGRGSLPFTSSCTTSPATEWQPELMRYCTSADVPVAYPGFACAVLQSPRQWSGHRPQISYA